MISPTAQSHLNIASKDKFLLVLDLPTLLRKRSKIDPSLDIEKLQLSVFGSVVPNITVPSVEVKYGGQSLNITSHSRPNYPPLSIKFVVDNQYNNYYILWSWLALLNDPETSLYGGTPIKNVTNDQKTENGNNIEYQTKLTIYGLNEYGKPAIQFDYTNAFITNLGGIDYSDREGSIIESTVDFQYNQFFIKKIEA